MIPTPALIEHYLSTLTGKGRAPNTVRAYRADLTDFGTWSIQELIRTQETPLPALDLMMERYLTEHRTAWQPSTFHRKMTALRGWAKYHGLPEALRDYRAPSPAQIVPHPLPEGIDGVLKLISIAGDPQREALVALCGLCGLRVGEALSTTVDDFDLSQHTLYVRGKGSKHRVVPYNTTAWEAFHGAIVLARGRSDKRLVTLPERAARRAITMLGQAAGMSRPIASHDLRATFATAAYEKTKDVRVVQELLGHASSVTTERYIGISMTTMRGALPV